MATRKKGAVSPADTLAAKKEEILHCSFCAKSQQEIKKLIAGPTAFICDECVELCNEILLDTDGSEPLYPFLVINKSVSGMLAEIGYLKTVLTRMTKQLDQVVASAKKSERKAKE